MCDVIVHRVGHCGSAWLFEINHISFVGFEGYRVRMSRGAVSSSVFKEDVCQFSLLLQRDR